MNTRKVSLILDFNLPEGISDTKAKTKVKERLNEMVVEQRIEGAPMADATFKVRTAKEDPRIATQATTIQQQDTRILELSDRLEKMTEALEMLHSSPVQATTVTVIQTVNAIIHAINNQQVEIPINAHSKTEYFRAGARAYLKATNTTIRTMGASLVQGVPLPTDAELFAYWIQEASNNPMKLMKALSGVNTIEGYREALTKLRNDDQAAYLAGVGQNVNEQGALQ